jgi:hypothetical protein
VCQRYRDDRKGVCKLDGTCDVAVQLCSVCAPKFVRSCFVLLILILSPRQIETCHHSLVCRHRLTNTRTRAQGAIGANLTTCGAPQCAKSCAEFAPLASAMSISQARSFFRFSSSVTLPNSRSILLSHTNTKGVLRIDATAGVQRHRLPVVPRRVVVDRCHRLSGRLFPSSIDLVLFLIYRTTTPILKFKPTTKQRQQQQPTKTEIRSGASGLLRWQRCVHAERCTVRRRRRHRVPHTALQSTLCVSHSTLS